MGFFLIDITLSYAIISHCNIQTNSMAEKKVIKQKKNTKTESKMAVIKLGGKQYLVSENDEINVEKVEKKVKSTFNIEDVLAVIKDNKEMDIGTPHVKSKVTVRVLKQGRGDKIHVIKYKPKIRYRRKIGHRQDYTTIKILSIN